MAENTARDYSYAAPVRKERQQEVPEIHTQSQRQPQHVAVSAFEKCLMTVIGVAVGVMMLMTVSVQNQIATAQRDLQNVAQKSTTALNSNNTLKQEIGELSSADRLEYIAQQQGLKLHESNIRNVSK
ncbi:hypothetical protein IV38_GL000242 [Lactobacillus selangorensis]|uniref:Cell division protein FtsL n=1 Tax=Lactobacillus selangorensis TaxID=81857 RepID=A0A0R2FZY6_9LACO|nr:cell division protein FtsL [Lactobacillus selangorensis]KRN29358.1 hypothetical protein IV38_GL000242 [Lactobacillus selangorensis]KRN34113.1 hypothetical protein IV40_GL000427 [Lactobacillus selangorensis]